MASAESAELHVNPESRASNSRAIGGQLQTGGPVLAIESRHASHWQLN